MYLWKGPSKGKRDTVILVGPAASGKTALFSKLCLGRASATAGSMASNEGKWPRESESEESADGSILRIVDLPGHERLRGAFTQHVERVRAIVYVVDASTLNRQLRTSASYLYDILVDGTVESQEIPLLIVAGKRDILTSLRPERVQALLEGEINKLRVTRTTAPESLDPDAEAEERTTFLGYEDQPFRFTHLPNPVEVCGMDNVTENGIQILENRLMDWLNEPFMN
ncbi:signal recognition particle receptor, beta subunit [Piptocephalis cylindrospora]|uniref:Signal recognition particle receptor subunit beta n=1 Tax=Piptocephalis cylindrospora TaxID=1907219 RepID=A0A4P9Y397_9FUNG|nr:signal recognition particle receptor, beta subunit [Piptocephalis cylindrospora]|eukprot:RKP12300.1 signal recognition particle receptor, beta subunit [Piptocephalis cylindrospora]